MIIYYHKKTGKIYGSILGRVHTEMELKPDLIQPQGVPQKDVVRKIFNLKGTKKLEEYFADTRTHILNYMVDVSDKDNVSLILKPEEPETKPDAVETILIDLTETLKEIEANFSETTRRWIKKANESYMTFREISFSEVKKVYDVLEEIEDMKDIRLAKHLLRIRAPFLDGFRRMYVVEDKEKKTLAVALITIRVDRLIYTLGGVTKLGRDTHAGDFLVYGLIKDAKELGFKTFDLGGIYADWADDVKKKVNEFKTRWGGTKEPSDIYKRG